MSAIILLLISTWASAYARTLPNDIQKKDVLPIKWPPTTGVIGRYPSDLIIGSDFPTKPSGPFGPIIFSKRDVIKEDDDSRSGQYWQDPTEKPSNPFGPVVVSRRDAEADEFDEEDVSVESLVELMTETIEEVQEDMSAKDLGDAAASVRYLADSLLAINGAQVNQQDVMRLILEIGAGFGNGGIDMSVLFDDPLKFEARALTFALRLWSELTNRLVQQNAEGSSVDVTLAAISFTADILENALGNTVRLMNDMAKGGHLLLTKRQTVNPSLSIDASKTFKFDGGSSLTLKGTVSTTDFSSVKVTVGVSFNF